MTPTFHPLVVHECLHPFVGPSEVRSETGPRSGLNPSPRRRTLLTPRRGCHPHRLLSEKNWSRSCISTVFWPVPKVLKVLRTLLLLPVLCLFIRFIFTFLYPLLKDTFLSFNYVTSVETIVYGHLHMFTSTMDENPLCVVLFNPSFKVLYK